MTRRRGFGGDEFALLIEGTASVEHCTGIAHKILQRMVEPFLLNDIPHPIGISIGISPCGEGEMSREQLMAQADEAMYAAKANPEQKYQFYNKQSEQSA